MKDRFNFTAPDLNDAGTYNVSVDTTTGNGVVTMSVKSKVAPFDSYQFEILQSYFPIVNGFENDMDYETDLTKINCVTRPTKFAYLCNNAGALIVRAGTCGDGLLPAKALTLLHNLPSAANYIGSDKCGDNPQFNTDSSSSFFESPYFIGGAVAFGVALAGFIGCAIYQTYRGNKFDASDFEPSAEVEKAPSNSGCWARMFSSRKNTTPASDLSEVLIQKTAQAPDSSESLTPRMS
jgi:hypothetical protein